MARYRMTLSQKAIQEFQRLYLEKLNETLTDTQAEQLALELLQVFHLIFSPFPGEHFDISNSKDTIEETLH
jgi:hypothetical protein